MAASSYDIMITRKDKLRREILSYKPGKAVPCDDERVVFPDKLVIGIVELHGYTSNMVSALRRALHGGVELSKLADESQTSAEDQEEYLIDSISIIQQHFAKKETLSELEEIIQDLAGKVGCMVMLLYPSYIRFFPEWIRITMKVTGRAPRCGLIHFRENNAFEQAKHALQNLGVTEIYGVPYYECSDDKLLQLLDLLHGCLCEADVTMLYRNPTFQQLCEQERKEATEAKKRHEEEISEQEEKKKLLQRRITELEQELNEFHANRESKVSEYGGLKDTMKVEQESREHSERALIENEKRAKQVMEMYKQREIELEEKLKSKDLRIETMVENLRRSEESASCKVEQLQTEIEEMTKKLESQHQRMEQLEHQTQELRRKIRQKEEEEEDTVEDHRQKIGDSRQLSGIDSTPSAQGSSEEQTDVLEATPTPDQPHLDDMSSQNQRETANEAGGLAGLASPQKKRAAQGPSGGQTIAQEPSSTIDQPYLDDNNYRQQASEGMDQHAEEVSNQITADLDDTCEYIPSGNKLTKDGKNVHWDFLTDSPHELKLQDNEVGISCGIKFSPSGAKLSEPIKVTLDHNAHFTNPRRAEIVFYTRNKGSKTFVRIPASTDGYPRCDVRSKELDLYVDHFCSWWIVAVTKRYFVGKRVNCTPYVKRPVTKGNTHLVQLCIYDDLLNVIKKTKEEMEEYRKLSASQQMFIEWKCGDITIKLFDGPKENEKKIDEKILGTRDINLVERKLFPFEVNPLESEATQKILKFTLDQQESPSYPTLIYFNLTCDATTTTKRATATVETIGPAGAVVLSMHACLQAAEVSPQSGGELPNDEFADILKQIADDLSDEAKIDSLGSQLGILQGDIARALKNNMRYEQITSRGTHLMLKKWREGVSREDEHIQLRRALVAAKLLDLADHFFPKKEE